STDGIITYELNNPQVDRGPEVEPEAYELSSYPGNVESIIHDSDDSDDDSDDDDSGGDPATTQPDSQPTSGQPERDTVDATAEATATG
ncbi:hypothetical protein, partial [Halorubrum sp. SP9]